MNYIFIEQVSLLEKVCEKMKKSSTIMVDTEFVRTRTFYPKLGLIQLFDGETLVLIDPIVIADLSVLWWLLADPSILKVFHACSEDLEVFQHYAGFIPSPLIDTQIMSAFLGNGLSTGFALLIDQYLEINLNKTQARTDWCARPLTTAQLNYAAADVYYLLPLYQLLKDQIDERGWQDGVMQECELLLLKRAKQPDPDNAYLNIKNAWQLNPKQLAALKMLASWRLQKAQKKDLALNFVVKDLHLWKMARYNIRSLDKMLDEGFHRSEVEHHGNAMLRIMSEIDKLSSHEYPPKIDRLVDKPAYKQGMKLIKEQITKEAHSLRLTPELIASNKQIHQLLKWLWIEKQAEDKLPEILMGWRSKYLSANLFPLLDELKKDEDWYNNL